MPRERRRYILKDRDELRRRGKLTQYHTAAKLYKRFSPTTSPCRYRVVDNETVVFKDTRPVSCVKA